MFDLSSGYVAASGSGTELADQFSHADAPTPAYLSMRYHHGLIVDYPLI